MRSFGGVIVSTEFGGHRAGVLNVCLQAEANKPNRKEKNGPTTFLVIFQDKSPINIRRPSVLVESLMYVL